MFKRPEYKIASLVVVISALVVTGVTLVAFTRPQLAYAATCTWTGNGVDTNWSNSDNWDGCVVPDTGDIVVFPSGANSNSTYNDIGTISLTSIEVSGPNYTLDGGPIQLTAQFIVTGSALVYNSIEFAGNGTELYVDYSPAEVRFNSPVSVGNYLVSFSVDGAAIFENGGTIVGAADSFIGISGDDNGYTAIHSDNTFNFYGVIELDGGHLQVHSPGSLGDPTSETVVLDGILELAYGGPIPETLHLSGGLVAAFANSAELSGVLDVTGPVSFVGDPYIPLIISGDLTGSSNYYTYGIVDITGVTSNDGQMQLCCITGNVLTVNGTLSSGVLHQGETDLIRGTGSLGPLDFRAGQLRPGIDDPGILTVNGNFDASTNQGLATYFVEVNGPTPGVGLDQIVVDGNVFLSGSVTLDLAVQYEPTMGQELMIIDNLSGNATTGTFVSIPGGSYILADNYYFRVDYDGGDGNDVVLTRENPPNDPTVITVATVTTPINEGGNTSLHLEFTDPNVGDSHDVNIYWQDSSVTSITLDPGITTYDVSHTYVNNGSYNIDIQVGDAETTDNVFRTVMVNNVVPTLTALNITGAGAEKTITGNIVDPGTQDTFTISINWNDGTAIQTVNAPGGATSFTANHTVSGTGNFTVNVVITDNASGSSPYSLVTSVSGSSSSSSSSTTTSQATTTSAPAEVVQPIIPVETLTGGEIVTEVQPEFKWEIPAAIVGANSINLYLVQLTDEQGNTLVDENTINLETIIDPQYLFATLSSAEAASYVPTEGLVLGSYRWVVVAADETGAQIAISPLNEFRIATDEQVNDLEDDLPSQSGDKQGGDDLPQRTTLNIAGIEFSPELQEVIVNTPAVPLAGALIITATVAAISTTSMQGMLIGLFLPKRRKSDEKHVSDNQKLFNSARWLLAIVMVFGILYTIVAFIISPSLINFILLYLYLVLAFPGVITVVNNFVSKRKR